MKLLRTLAGAALPLALGAVSAAADPVGNSAYYGHMDGWGMGLMGLGMMILFWGGLAALIVLAVRGFGDRNGGGGSGRRTDALNILKERLARGEIEPADYEARRKYLES